VVSALNDELGAGWKNPRTTPPPNGVVVEVTGSDHMGDWRMMAMRMDYQKKPTNTKRFIKTGSKFWRWVDLDGCAINAKDVPELWRDHAGN
jgi:hypothetical protein